MPDVLFDIHLVLTSALVGLIWTIQLVHYPAKHFIAADEFIRYELFHQRQISFVVLPLMLGELSSAAALAFFYFADGSLPMLFSLSLCMLLGVWASTFFIQVPLHSKLATGKDPVAIRRLVSSNWLRTALWTTRLICLLAVAHQAGQA